MLFCGIDIGSTNAKVVLADEAGRSVWVKSLPSPRRHDGIGIATDAIQMVALLEDLIIEGWNAAGKGKPLAAIAVAGVGEDGVCTDRDLAPLGLAIPWFDKRALAEVKAFAGRHALTRADFHTTAAKWMWLNKHRAVEIGAARWWITLTDYAPSIWCGAPFISETLAARTGCYDVFTRKWSDEALAFSGAPPLPRILKAGEIAGTIRNGRLLQAGAADTATLVVAAGHDHPIASSAIQRLDHHARIDSIGTANAVYGETRAPHPDLEGSGLEASVPARGGPGISLIGVTEFSATLMESFGGEAAVRKLLAHEHLPDAGGSDDRARFTQMLTAMAERAAHFLPAFDRAGVPEGTIFATGGWSRSNALMQLRAEIFGKPITVVDEPELTALAAALLAIEAAGHPAEFHPRNGLHVIEPRR